MLRGVNADQALRKTRAAADGLDGELSRAKQLEQHVSEFMDWKKDLDKEMDFGSLQMMSSPARPSLTVVSPPRKSGASPKPRWSWSHQQRDLEVEVQELTDKFVKEIDEHVGNKEKEIMTV